MLSDVKYGAISVLKEELGLNPLERVTCFQTTSRLGAHIKPRGRSQSPRTGHMLSDWITYDTATKSQVSSQSPRTGHMLSDTVIEGEDDVEESLNPLERVTCFQTIKS